MEHLLGQPSQFVHCTNYSSLTEAISTMEQHIKVLIVSCLSSIIGELLQDPEPQHAIEHTMNMIGGSLYDVVRYRKDSVRIYVAPSTPRHDPDFSGHSKFALVRFYYLRYLSCLDSMRFVCFSSVCQTRCEKCVKLGS